MGKYAIYLTAAQAATLTHIFQRHREELEPLTELGAGETRQEQVISTVIDWFLFLAQKVERAQWRSAAEQERGP